MELNEQTVRALFAERFSHDPQIVTRAPGRVEFIGNHTDYNGGAVLGAAINRYVWVAASRSSRARMRFSTEEDGAIIEALPAQSRSQFVGAQRWINYPIGVWKSLEEFHLPRPESFDLLVLSDLPIGAGLSSSAALELAAALAFLGLATSRPVDPAEIAAIGRHSENIHVGVPCGILDQGTSAFGAPGKLVHIDCRGPSFATVPIPADARLWVFNTLEKHALVDGFYADRHRECTAAAQALNVRWLAQLPPGDLPDAQRNLATPFNLRARHVVEEHARVAGVVAALQTGDLASTGRLLKESHRSSQALFENSTPALDSLVNLLSAHPRVFGARLTGGGFGGAVLALTGREFDATDAQVIATVHANLGHPHPQVLALQTAEGAKVIWRSMDCAGPS